MTEPIDYPGHGIPGALPDGAHQQAPQGFGYPPLPPPQQPKPSRVNKVAAWVGLAAGSLVIVAVLFGGGFYLGRATAPVPRPEERSQARVDQGGPMIIPMPRGQFEQPGPGIVIPNGPTFQLPNIFPQLPQPPSTQSPGQPPR